MPTPNQPTDVFKLYDMSQTTTECWVWRGAWGGRPTGKRPYFMCDGVRTMAYRVVYGLVNGTTLTPDQSLLHSCDNGAWPIGCGNPQHLRVGTTRENANDRVERQRHGLPHSVVQAIRKLLAQGQTQLAIAELYGVSRETISAIATGRTYQQVKDTSDDELAIDNAPKV
jgi:DNA-binding XRE family transcriptional regulator